ncbi:MAG: enolase, partial [Chloroflexota bacterium]
TVRAALFAGLDGIAHPSELSFFLKLKDDIATEPIVIEDGFIDLRQLTDISVDTSRLEKFSV